MSCQEMRFPKQMVQIKIRQSPHSTYEDMWQLIGLILMMEFKVGESRLNSRGLFHNQSRQFWRKLKINK